eukprot:GEMP01068971.1.p1 GENE.GEMP01068971.1~~GEMP01068971.1.p1  ORF type:complete len:199 (+),score=33.26 GEMP01068971.1:87-683(+)
MGCISASGNHVVAIDGLDIADDTQLRETLLSHQYTGAVLLIKGQVVDHTYDVAQNVWSTHKKSSVTANSIILLKIRTGQCLFLGIPEESFVWKILDSFRNCAPGFAVTSSTSTYFDGKLVLEFIDEQRLRQYVNGSVFGYSAFGEDLYKHIINNGTVPPKAVLKGSRPGFSPQNPLIDTIILQKGPVYNASQNPFAVD